MANTKATGMNVAGGMRGTRASRSRARARAAAATALQHQKDKNSDQRIAKQNALLEGKSGFSPEERAAFKGRRSRVAGDMREIGRAAAEKTAQSFHDKYAPKMDEGIEGLQKLNVDEEMSPTPPAQAPEPAPAPAPAPTPEQRSDQLETFFAMEGDKIRFSPAVDPYVYEYDPQTKAYTIVDGPQGVGATFGPDHPAAAKFDASREEALQQSGSKMVSRHLQAARVRREAAEAEAEASATAEAPAAPAPARTAFSDDPPVDRTAFSDEDPFVMPTTSLPEGGIDNPFLPNPAAGMGERRAPIPTRTRPAAEEQEREALRRMLGV